MKFKLCSPLILCAFSLLAGAGFARSQATAFTYQGSLKQSGASASGNYDFQFGLFTNLSGGTAVMTITNLNVAVSNGLFVTTVDFGGSFTGAPYLLDIALRTNGSAGAFTSVSPRQTITPTPYALYSPSAGNVSGVLNATNLPATVAYLNSNQVFTGTITAASFSGDGSGLTNISGAAGFTNYIFSYDTTTQSFSSSPGTFQAVYFNNAGYLNGGWVLSPSGPSRDTFTAINGGIYLVEYQAELSGTAGRTASLRATLNGTEIVGSQSAVTLGTNTVTSIQKSFLAAIPASQVLELQFTADNLSLNLTPGGVGTTKPGVSLTIIRVN